MSSGADEKASVGDNIVNEQPIEISSDSGDEEDMNSSMAGSDTESDVSVLSSFAGSTDSHDDQKIADEFSAILAIPNKRYKHYIDLCTTAFQLNVFEKIEVAIDEFQQKTTMPPHIWLRYLKTLKVVTQTPEEHAVFEEKCKKALDSLYDDQLAEFVVNSFKEELVEHHALLAEVLADYGLERGDIVEDLRNLLKDVTNKEDAEKIEKLFSEKCVTWNYKKEDLESITSLIEEFKQKLKSSTVNSSWLQESVFLRAETLGLSANLKCSLAKLIYERCIVRYPTDSQLWLDYIAHMERPIEPGNEAMSYTAVTDGYLKCKPLELINRVLKMKPTISLNHKFLDLMEKNQFSREQVDTEIMRHLERLEPYMDMNVEFQLDYLAYRVRQVDVNDEEQVKELRAAFRQVWDRLSELYGDLADTRFEVLQLWAQVEYAKLNNPENGAAIWCEIFNYPGSSTKSHLWLSYAQMESEYNKGQKMSVVLRQALAALSMTPEAHVVAELYRRNERCLGSYKSISECQAYCEAYVDIDNSADTYKQTGFSQQSRRRQAPQPKPDKKPPQRSPRKPAPPVAKKLPPPAPAAKEPRESNFKYSANMEANKIFIKNLYPKCTKEELTEAFKSFGNIKDVRLVYKQNNQRFKGIAYIEFEKPEQAQAAVMSGDGMEIGGQSILVAISNPPPKQIPGASTSSAAAGSAAAAPADQRRPEKRRIQTSLIPTRLVLNEVKRRKKLDLESDVPASSSIDANGKNDADADANGNDKDNANETKESEQKASISVPKSNDDFRKLFNI